MTIKVRIVDLKDLDHYYVRKAPTTEEIQNLIKEFKCENINSISK